MKYLILLTLLSGCAHGSAALKGFAQGFNQNNRTITCTTTGGNNLYRTDCE